MTLHEIVNANLEKIADLNTFFGDEPTILKLFGYEYVVSEVRCNHDIRNQYTLIVIDEEADIHEFPCRIQWLKAFNTRLENFIKTIE